MSRQKLDNSVIRGDAVDFNFDGIQRLYNQLKDTYNGGLAIYPGSFLHIDNRGYKARWNY